MAWLAVDINGCEWIFQNKPKQFEGLWEDAIYESFDGQGGALEYHHNSDILLPKGSIKKLIGRDLTWQDEPIELRNE